jgi:hypothetical protein
MSNAGMGGGEISKMESGASGRCQLNVPLVEIENEDPPFFEAVFQHTAAQCKSGKRQNIYIYIKFEAALLHYWRLPK